MRVECYLVMSLSILSACPSSSGDNTPDSGSVDASQAETDAASTVDAPPELPELTFNLPIVGSGPADLSCLGQRTSPAPGAQTTIAMPVRPFGAPPQVALPGAVVQFFPGNQVDIISPCTAPSCSQVTANQDGVVNVEIPARAWFAYRALAISNSDPEKSFWQTVEYNLDSDRVTARSETVNTISEAAMLGLADQADVTLDRERGVISGAVLDCHGRPMIGAVARVFSGDDGTSDPGTTFSYFGTQTPPAIDPTLVHTSASGRYAIVNTPPGDVRVEIWGRPPGSNDVQLIACEPAAAFAESLTVLVMLPMRSDGPTACGSVARDTMGRR